MLTDEIDSYQTLDAAMEKKRVLVIEDAEAIRQLLETSLSDDGFEVVHCVDGTNGLEAALTMNPDVVLLDIALPGMDGWEVLRRLRADPRGQHIPVVVITAHNIAEAKTKPIAAEADGVFGKPFRLQRVRVTVAALAAHGRNRAA